MIHVMLKNRCGIGTRSRWEVLVTLREITSKVGTGFIAFKAEYMYTVLSLES